MSTKEKRKDFESKINYMVDEKIKEYLIAAKKKYLSDIRKIYENNDLEQEYLILENNNKIDFVEKEYPYYYEFLSIPLVNEKNIKEILDSIADSDKKYTVLYQYLTMNHKEINYLQTFSKINNFVNYTISHYSNLISRKEALERKIKEEISNKNIPKRLFDEFLSAYNDYKLYQISIQYRCHNLEGKVESRKLSEEDSLGSFLIDNGVQGQGMKLAALYEKYSSIQNSFLDNVISNIDTNNKKLEYLKNKISSIINPQRANQYNIISFNISKESYSFLEMVLFYSYKDSFDSNYNYDFSKKDKIKYNFEELEEQLESLLLPGKKKINDEIEFVTYQFEGFRNKHSDLLSSFLLHYPQTKLDDQKKQSLYKFNT